MSVSKKSTRQSRIMEIIRSLGYDTIENLAHNLSVSEQTIRRDIVELDQNNLLRRTHGGAAYSGELEATDLVRRRSVATNVKLRIARKVAELVRDGDSVFLDAGTTIEAVATALLERKDLKVVTYSVGVAYLLKDRTDFTVAIPGGFLRHIDGSVMGEPSSEFIKKFRFDVSVISASAIDSNGEMGDDDPWEVSNVRTAMERSTTTIMAVHSSKFFRTGLVTLGSVSDVDSIVTDQLPEGPLGDLMRQAAKTYVV
ncbi:DeoR/GlpR family DNA-binding transcription regulator [Candidatus Halocynthiibacter alkanivorans]|jgi:DeoR family transcriptional regulator, glycerol-3-phosphate regulon repressor|uniref:DeoR/GlpR family DNA-binding transcription regulator n=1 Tax=Candidatus Halocynthiibacter alkanivorans TaxID=2267619 RepID=UPI000DF2F4CE|nr:DeoR/GlpR family DNA-binding transcription regulator [Candidatus Halocynthiibacter alkanivorans]